MHTNDLLLAAERAVSSFFLGSDSTKINLREAMTDLRVCVEREKKKQAVLYAVVPDVIIKAPMPEPAPVTYTYHQRPPPFNPGNQPHGAN